MDRGCQVSLGRHVTEDERDRLKLAQALSTQAGMLFEDASSEALLIGALGPGELRVRVNDLLSVNGRAEAMLNAAQALWKTVQKCNEAEWNVRLYARLGQRP